MVLLPLQGVRSNQAFGMDWFGLATQTATYPNG